MTCSSSLHRSYFQHRMINWQLGDLGCEVNILLHIKIWIFDPTLCIGNLLCSKFVLCETKNLWKTDNKSKKIFIIAFGTFQRKCKNRFATKMCKSKCNNLFYKLVLTELRHCGKIIRLPKLFHLRISIKFRSLSWFLILIWLHVLIF